VLALERLLESVGFDGERHGLGILTG